MTEEERDERKQVEEGREEDLELDEPESGEVPRVAMKKLPGAKKWGDLTMKKGRTDSR